MSLRRYIGQCGPWEVAKSKFWDLLTEGVWPSVHSWLQKCGCQWSMAQPHMPNSVPLCLIILSNQPIFHYQMRLMYQIFILSVYHYFTTKTCCHVKLLGFSAINWSGLLEFEIQDWEHGWDRFFQYEKMNEVRTSLIFWFKLIYKQNTPVSGRFLEKKWIYHAFFTKKRGILKIFIDFD